MDSAEGSVVVSLNLSGTKVQKRWQVLADNLGETNALAAGNPSSWAQLARSPTGFRLQKQAAGGENMKSYLQLLIALTTVIWVGVATASETKVVISLSEQRAYLIE